ncbi:VOC family protein [Aquisphaera insulae]|uniref:VOC family protein n=1 Tax=Aquisphaera insulae TaxID=2712864 RepID=UPI0013E9FDF3|nr:VOC family protein [Aquisphaera insulae]
MPDAVTHFEIYADEPTRLVEFYGALFGWQIEQLPGIEYWRVQTGGDGAEAVGGGLLRRPIPGPQSWVHYVHVASVEAAVSEIQRLGGSVIRPRAAVAKVAWYAVVADPEGNIFAVWQADPTAFPTPEPD